METIKNNNQDLLAKIEKYACLAKEIMAETNKNILSKKELIDIAEKNNVPTTDFYGFLVAPEFRASRGKYDLRLVVKRYEDLKNPAPASKVESQPTSATVVRLATQDTSDDITYIPETNPLFVRWGNYSNVAKVLESNQFFPIYIAGPSGNGKTFMIEQAAAHKKRKFIRIQLTPETDEDDLIGGFRLVDGNTVFCKGPVIRAMEEGSVLLLDEIDRVTNKIMCLQSVLEGKSVLIKKTGETVHPRPGFNVIATANTNGRGSEDGRYTAASIIDDAFLERFPITMVQGWATPAIETNILKNHAKKFDITDMEFLDKLVVWANIIRQTFKNGGVDDEISTRRLCHIVQTFSIFPNRILAIKLAINRYCEETREPFLDLYTKVDEGSETLESLE